jgi:hypothetical protein
MSYEMSILPRLTSQTTGCHRISLLVQHSHLGHVATLTDKRTPFEAGPPFIGYD